MGDEQLNQNLAQAREQFGSGRLFAREDGDVFEVDGVRFECDYASGSTSRSFYIVKPVAHVRNYVDRCRRHRGGVFVELGIAEGGSAALALLEGAPSRFVAYELESNRLEALDDFVAERGLGAVATAHYGVDQGDRDHLRSLVAQDLDGTRIDVVFDDASHILEPTRTSFEVLFPHLRPGGEYVIEDWCQGVRFQAAMIEHLRSLPPEERAELFRSGASTPKDPEPDQRPLLDLTIELLLAHAGHPDVIAGLRLDEHGVVVERGPRELDDTFRLADHVHDPGYLP